MSQIYTHRNGEKEPPTVEGYYWFDGNEESEEYRFTLGMTYVGETQPRSGVYVAWGIFGVFEQHDPKKMDGRWWGPVTPPWEPA